MREGEGQALTNAVFLLSVVSNYLSEFILYNLKKACFKNKKQTKNALEPKQLTFHFFFSSFDFFFVNVFQSFLLLLFPPPFSHSSGMHILKIHLRRKLRKKCSISCKKYIENPFPKILICGEKSCNISDQPEAQQHFLLSLLPLESITTAIVNRVFTPTNKGLLRINGFQKEIIR